MPKRGTVLVGPHERLYIGELFERAISKVDEIRRSQPRWGKYGASKAFTTRKIALGTGMNPLTVKEYLESKRNRIPPDKLDSVMAFMGFDLLDLLSPAEISEILRRRGTHFRKRVKSESDAGKTEKNQPTTESD